MNVLFLAHCTREKGLFAAIEAVRRANRLLEARALPLRLRLNVAGNFVTPEAQVEFETLCRNAGARRRGATRRLCQRRARKAALYREADLLYFPRSISAKTSR